MGKKILDQKIRRYLNGKFIILIQCYDDSFRLTLTVLPNFSKNLTFNKTGKVAIHIAAKADIIKTCTSTRIVYYPKKADGTLKLIDVKVPYTTHKIIGGDVTLPPEIYLPPEVLKCAESQEKANKNPLVNLHPTKYQASLSKFVPYSKTNINHPYRG